MADRAFKALVTKLHRAELDHLREVVATQQALIESQAAQIEDLQRAVSWSEDRAEMFQDLAHELQGTLPGVVIGLTKDGHAGVLQ